MTKERDTYLTNTRRQGRTNPMAIGVHDSSFYGAMMVGYGTVMA